MALQQYLLLGVAGLLALGPVLATRVERLERVLQRLAIVGFGDYVERVGRQTEGTRLLRAAHVPATYRTYAATSVLYAALGAVVGGILGMYAIWGVLRVLALDRSDLQRALPTLLEPLAIFGGLETLEPVQLFAIVLISGLVVGSFGGVLTYWFRWWWPEHVAATRERSVDGTMPQAVAFAYALSRSGMALPKILRIVADHRRVYGAAAAEVEVAVRHVDLFGRDVITAIQQTSRTSPSEQFSEFAENLASVLQSGRNLSAFLEAQYEDLQTEAEAQQRRILELLATLAEAYVTVFVAGPLFFVTIMVVIGLAGANTSRTVSVFAYFVLPLGNLWFVLYLDTVTDRFGRRGTADDLPDVEGSLASVRLAERAPDDVARASGDGGRAPDDAGQPGTDAERAASDGGQTVTDGGGTVTGGGDAVTGGGDAVTDGGAQTGGEPSISGGRESSRAAAARRTANLERLALHERVDGLRERIGNPLRTVLRRPVTLLYVTVPLALLVTVLRAGTGAPDVRVLDDLLVQATLAVLGTFAVAYELHRRRVRAVEAAVPDFLDRLASVNEAGLSVVDSIGRVRGSELGALGPEVDRVWRDVQWGATLETALQRFERRVRTRTVSRVVSLITNAMHASGDISRVLRIAATQAKADRRLRERRRQELLSYLVVIYVSFLVFLVIVVALDAVLIPSLPDSSVAPDVATDAASGAGSSAGSAAGQSGGSGAQQVVRGQVPALEGIGTVPAEAFRRVFFHTALIQGLLSGFVAGQMSAGDLRNGAKHAAIMVAIAYVALLAV